jgi:hypothetical protein
MVLGINNIRCYKFQISQISNNMAIVFVSHGFHFSWVDHLHTSLPVVVQCLLDDFNFQHSFPEITYEYNGNGIVVLSLCLQFSKLLKSLLKACH